MNIISTRQSITLLPNHRSRSINIRPIVTRLCYGESGYSTLFFALRKSNIPHSPLIVNNNLFPQRRFSGSSGRLLFFRQLSVASHAEYRHHTGACMTSDYSSDIVNQNIINPIFSRTSRATYSASSMQSPWVIIIISLSQPFACSAAISTILFRDRFRPVPCRSPGVFRHCPYV